MFCPTFKQATFALTLIAGATLLRASEQTCKVTIDAKAAMNLNGTPAQKIISVTTLEYKRVLNDKVVSIYAVSESLKMSVDGTLQRDSVSNRDGMIVTTPEGTRNLRVKDAPAANQKRLLEQYDTPASVLRVDNDGRVVKDESPMTETAIQARESGFATNYQLFHGCFMAGKSSWEEETGVAGSGKPVRGILKYEKQAPKSDANLVPVKVSGELATELPVFGDITMPVIYAISGEQVYDLRERNYVSGKLTMKIGTKPGANVPMTMEGTAEVTMTETKPGLAGK